MAISVGGLAMVSLPKPFAELVRILLSKGDLRSIFALVVFCIVFLVLAYLTNPSESSFRAYLTEQSFRKHLSRLDDDSRHSLPFDNSSPFHFANRASVSLRTPKHVFHSFGILTVAAMVPLPKQDPHRSGADVSIMSDSWYIGAFGRWYRGGVLEAWYQDVIARSSDEESWSSGILGMKTLDRTTEYNALPGLPFSTKNLPPHGNLRGSPPRLRNRDKSSQRSPSRRSSTPPPLPKTASLPLHTSRHSPDRPPLLPTPVIDQQHIVPPGPSASTLFDQSPRVAELLRQISHSKASVIDLRAQLTESEAAASQSHSALQAELESFRERKRQEDLARTELKTRTKNLDDQKRNAEAIKRDAEKRLKAAEAARDDATERMAFLDKEISQLQQCLVDDRSSISRIKDSIPEAEQDIVLALEHKRREIKAAEDVLAALNARTRDLEDTVTAEKQRLALMREKAEHPAKQEGMQTFGYGSSHENVSPRPAKLSLGNISNLNRLGSLPIVPSFTPFGDGPLPILSPTSTALIPSGLISSMETTTDTVSRSFRSENDVILDRDWQNGDGPRAAQPSPAYAPVTTSPVSTNPEVEVDPFEVRHNLLDMQRLTALPQKVLSSSTEEASTRNWFSHKKALNPDAKVFSLSRKHALSSTPSSYDALNPNGIATSSSASNPSFLRAFAPSPAEREALQRALGGSTNTSLERLPSLSDVGSIPSSPSLTPHESSARVPSWLQTLPHVRKPNFSPWDDENGN